MGIVGGRVRGRGGQRVPEDRRRAPAGVARLHWACWVRLLLLRFVRSAAPLTCHRPTLRSIYFIRRVVKLWYTRQEATEGAIRFFSA